MAHTIEPSAIPESFTVDNQRIAFPAADGVAHPSRVRVRRECTAIKKDLTVYGVLLVKNDDEIRRLDDLVRQWNGADGRHAGRLASGNRVEFPLALQTLFEQRRAPRCHRNICRIEVGHDVHEIAGSHRVFDIIRLSFGIGLGQPNA